MNMSGVNTQLDEQLQVAFRGMGLPAVVEDLETHLEAYYRLIEGKD